MKIRGGQLLAAFCLFVLAIPSRAHDAVSLESAIVANNPVALKAALDAGVNINVDLGQGRTPLITAVMFSRPQMVKLLLERGADPNHESQTPMGNAVNAAFSGVNGITLMGRDDRFDAAAYAASVEVLRLVVASKPNCDLLVRQGTTQMSALMVAADGGALDAVKILLAGGASAKLLNGGKYSALDYAATRPPMWSSVPIADRAEIVRLLLAAGAEPHHKGADGLTAVDRGRLSGNQRIVAMLAETH